jgi:hypothetical protein
MKKNSSVKFRKASVDGGPGYVVVYDASDMGVVWKSSKTTWVWRASVKDAMGTAGIASTRAAAAAALVASYAVPLKARAEVKPTVTKGWEQTVRATPAALSYNEADNAPPTGYVHCACRDCMETTVGPTGTICSDCTDAGCDAFYTECRRSDAYGGEDEVPAEASITVPRTPTAGMTARAPLTPYTLLCDGVAREIEASDMQDAREQARDWATDGSYDTSAGYVYVTVYIMDTSGECMETVSVALPMDEPQCDNASGEHDWQGPYGIVGGLRENPGVWGHGGGVVINRVCMTCGCGKRTDTWAQRRDTGEQGLTEVTYQVDQYRDAIDARRRAEEETDAASS